MLYECVHYNKHTSHYIVHKCSLHSYFPFVHSTGIIVTLEDTLFVVEEDIRENDFALQICAIAEEVEIPFVLTASPAGGTAEGIFIMLAEYA